MHDQRKEPEQRDTGYGVADLIFVRIDHGARRHDGGVAADRGPDGDQQAEAARQPDCTTEPRYEQQRSSNRHECDRHRDQPCRSGREQTQAYAEQCHANAQDALQAQRQSHFVDRRHPDRIADQQPAENGDQDRTHRRRRPVEPIAPDSCRDRASDRREADRDPDSRYQQPSRTKEFVSTLAPTCARGPFFRRISNVGNFRQSLHTPDEAKEFGVRVGIAGSTHLDRTVHGPATSLLFMLMTAWVWGWACSI